MLLFACARLGAMQVPLNWRLAEPELALILEDSEAVAVLASPELRPVAQRAAPPGCDVLDAEAAWPGWYHPGWRRPQRPTCRTPSNRRTRCCWSIPAAPPASRRAPCSTTAALLFNALNSQHMHALTAADRVLTVLPLFHVGGLNIQTTPALLAGAEVVLLPRFDPAGFLAASPNAGRR